MPLYISLPSPLFNELKDLPLDPYILGLLLGGKSFRESQKLNLCNNFSHKKFIPKIYKEASIEQRLELLRGLMNNTKTKYFVKRFETSSYQLALDIQYLARSLGALCKIITKHSTYTCKGVKKQDKTSYRCFIRHPNPEILYGKVENFQRNKEIMLKCKIKSIEYLGKQNTQCIMIDHPDHLYITDDFVITHNSTWCKQMILKNWIVINPDSIRLALHGSPFKPEAEGLV